MTEVIDEAFFSGRPMDITSISEGDPSLIHLPLDARLVNIEEARESLPRVLPLIAELQAMNDEAHDLTEELEILLETLQPEDDHVAEVAEYLAKLVSQWQLLVERIEDSGAKIACLEPARLEWYGVVDNHLALYSWSEGEEDIEWYHPVDAGFPARKPLIEA